MAEFLPISVFSGVRVKVRKDTECPFLRNVLDPTPLDTMATPNLDNTGCFVQRTGGITWSPVNRVGREAFEMIGAQKSYFRYCSQGSSYYVSVFGQSIDYGYGEQFQVLVYDDLTSPTMIDLPNPCIKAVEGFNLTSRCTGLVHSSVGEATPSNRTVLLYAD